MAKCLASLRRPGDLVRGRGGDDFAEAEEGCGLSRSIQLNLVSLEIYNCKMLDVSKHNEDEVKVAMAPGSSKSATVAAPEAKVVRHALQAHPRTSEKKAVNKVTHSCEKAPAKVQKVGGKRKVELGPSHLDSSPVC
jgi:hypothetical protein